jgi:hypothetical protein
MDNDSSPDDRRIMTPVERWFMLLKHFDEVPLPDGRVFSQVGTELREKHDGNWKRSEIPVNEFLECISGLSTEDWRTLIRNCSGGEAADQWREKILNHRISGNP